MRGQGGLSAQSGWGLQLGARCVPRDLGVLRRPGPEVATAPERSRGSEPPDPFWAPPPPPQPGQASCPQVPSGGLGRLREVSLGPGRRDRLPLSSTHPGGHNGLVGRRPVQGDRGFFPHPGRSPTLTVPRAGAACTLPGP